MLTPMRAILFVGALLGSTWGCAAPAATTGLSGPPPVRDEVAAAAYDPPVATLQRGRLYQLHSLDQRQRCGGRCILRTDTSSLVTIGLSPNGVVALQDEGHCVERFRSTVMRANHRTDWQRSWTGSWTEGNGGLQITLAPSDAVCQRTGSDGSERLPCAAEPLQLGCVHARVPLKGPPRRDVSAWVCSPRKAPSSDMATPFPWVFGIENTVSATDRVRGPWAKRRLDIYE